MSHKKPTPILGAAKEKICPICGKRSYSSAGIHPQCAVQQADAPRQELLKRSKTSEAEKKPAAKNLPQHWRQKKCPKCEALSHVRQKICGCGYDFFKS